jgi:hypothetical protein
LAAAALQRPSARPPSQAHSAAPPAAAASTAPAPTPARLRGSPPAIKTSWWVASGVWRVCCLSGCLVQWFWPAHMDTCKCIRTHAHAADLNRPVSTAPLALLWACCDARHGPRAGTCGAALAPCSPGVNGAAWRQSVKGTAAAVSLFLGLVVSPARFSALPRPACIDHTQCGPQATQACCGPQEFCLAGKSCCRQTALCGNECCQQQGQTCCGGNKCCKSGQSCIRGACYDQGARE